jgi:hypothetical protein
MSILRTGDEVAILPYVWAAPSEVLEIVKIHFAGAVITELADGRMFATGVGVGFNNTCFMTRAREVHRAALNGPTRNWNTAELELLKHYSDKEISKMSDRTMDEIAAKRRKF